MLRRKNDSPIRRAFGLGGTASGGADDGYFVLKKTGSRLDEQANQSHERIIKEN